MTLKTQAISSLFWRFFERGGSGLVAMLVQIVMARLLSPDDFGALALLAVFVNIGSVFVQSGLNTALVQSPDEDEADYSTVFWMSAAIAAVLFVVIFLCAPWLADFYENAVLIWPLRILALVLLLDAYNSVQVAKVTKDLELRKTFNATLAAMVISGIVGVATALLGAGLWALVFQQLVYQGVTCLALRLQVAWRPRLVFKLDRARLLFGYGWKLLVSGLLNTGYQSFSTLIIGKQFSANELGFVTQGEKYPQALGSMIDGAIQPVMLSTVARIQDDKRAVKELTRRALKTSSFLVVPVMGALAICAEPLVSLLLGEKWLPSVPFFQIYCFAWALYPIHTSNLQALNGIGRSDLFLRLEIIKKVYGIIILCTAAFALHSIYAIVLGVALASVISCFVNAFPNRYIIKYGYLEQVQDLAPAFLLTAISAVVPWVLSLWNLPDLLKILICPTLMAALYLGAAKLLKVEELEYLIATMRELKSERGSKRNRTEES